MRFGRYLPVHCCCDPDKRLGWVPCELQFPGPVKFRAGYIAQDLLSGVVTHPPVIKTEAAMVTVYKPHKGVAVALAVKSAHVPIETWRRVPGFKEDKH